MDAKELKFLLKLLGYESYRATLTQIQPTPKMKAPERNSICAKLRERDLVNCSEEVKKFAIAPPGESLLQIDSAGLPITDEELKVLKASAKGTISPGQTGIPADKRQAVIHSLANRGFIKIVDRQIKEVWLAARGKEYLREEFESNSTSANINLQMLTNYLRFMRKFQHVDTSVETASQDEHLQTPPQPLAEEKELVTQTPQSKPSDEEILQLIRNLDRKLGTENYLPIFHLRQKLQPPLSRNELDKALYRLEGEEKIEMSTLQEAIHYTPKQIEAGIPQEVGGPLFYIVMTENL